MHHDEPANIDGVVSNLSYTTLPSDLPVYYHGLGK